MTYATEKATEISGSGLSACRCVPPGAMRRKPGSETLAIPKRATVCWRLSVSRYVTGSGQERRLANLSPHCLLRGRRTRASRQLQHGRTLTLAQAREQHYLPVWEFQRVVMGHGVVHVDLPEACEPLPDLLVWQDTDAERRITFDILVERNFGAGQQADRNLRLAGRRKTARDGIGEFGRHQLVLDPGRPGRDMVQTIVTHRRDSFSSEKPGWLSASTSRRRVSSAGHCPDLPAISPSNHPGIPPDDFRQEANITNFMDCSEAQMRSVAATIFASMTRHDGRWRQARPW